MIFTRKTGNSPSEPAVSVLTPVYNVARYLPECLDSLKSQRLSSIEFVCINDGSTDESLSILRSYAKDDPRFLIIDKPNSGYGSSMNRGIEAAHGEYIGIVESDDFASPDMFKKLYRFAKKNDCDLVKTNFFEHDDFGDKKIRLYDGFAYRKVFDPKDEPGVMRVVPSIWAGLYRRSMLLDNEIRFNETPGASFQDTSFVHKTWMSARRAALLDGAFLHYRVDNSGSSVKASTKVYAVCDEYSSSETFMEKDPDCVKAFSSVLTAMKFDAYLWNYNRIADEFRKEFAMRWSREMRCALEKGWLDESLFSQDDKKRLRTILEEPDCFDGMLSFKADGEA